MCCYRDFSAKNRAQFGLIKHLLSKGPEETAEIAANFAQALPKQAVVCLHGDLGAGKTHFAKSLIHNLTKTPKEAITSPTFTYMNLYSKECDATICHFDLYRLEDETSFIQKGFEEYLYAPYTTIVEWPDRISALTEHLSPLFHVKIAHRGNTHREIEIHAND